MISLSSVNIILDPTKIIVSCFDRRRVEDGGALYDTNELDYPSAFKIVSASSHSLVDVGLGANQRGKDRARKRPLFYSISF